MITALVLALAAPPPQLGNADDAQLTDQDRAQIVHVFRYDWEQRRDKMLAQYPKRRNEVLELVKVEVIRCSSLPGLPGCDLRLTARRPDGQTKTGELGWRFRRFPDGTWGTASVSSGLNTSK